MAKDVPYCSRPEDFELLPKVGQGIKLLNDKGFKVIVITNQSGIARGYFTAEMLDRIHQKMRDDLAAYGAHIDAIYYCPHHPNDGCNCRKPRPALIYQAAKEHDIELGESFLIGDQLQDVEAGYSAGCKTCLLSPSGTSGMPPYQHSAAKPDFVAHDFWEACSWICDLK